MDQKKSKAALKEYMVEKLSVVHGVREAQNITNYYLDACPSSTSKTIDLDLAKLLSGMPVQYVTEVSFFYGHQFFVDQRVLIPRPETEELVFWVISDVGGKTKSILDIGTGSGCILLSVLKKASECRGYGLDVSSKAMQVFNLNKTRLNVQAESIVGSILDPYCIQFLNTYDVIISNPPYILDSEKNRMGEGVVSNEPSKALFVDGTDPLIFYKQIMEFGLNHLKPRGAIYFETSDLYHEELKSICKVSDYEYEFKKDMQGNWRMLKLTKA